MTVFYIVPVVLAIALGPFLVLGALNRVSRWRRARTAAPVVLCLLAVMGCSSSVAPTPTTTTAPPHTHDGVCDEGWADCNHSMADGCEVNATLADNCGACGTVCSMTQACGIGCGSKWGCWTPGGAVDAGPNDCPACFPAPTMGPKCPDPAYPSPYVCQTSATIGGCMASATGASYLCCPAGGGQ